MKPIEKFADYNRDIILGNLIQAETHLKNISDTSDPNFSACINKHLLESEMEFSELIAHEPEKSQEYRDLMIQIRKLRKDNINKGMLPDEAISRLRNIRDRFEKHIPGHNVEECKACDPNIETELKGLSKTLNRESDKLFNMDKKTLTQGLIGTAMGKGIHYGTGAFVPGASFGIANKTLLNLAIGLGIDIYALMKPRKLSKYGVPLVSAANYLLVEEIGNMLLGMVPSAARYAPRVSVAPANNSAKMVVSASPAVSVPSYANGRHIFVD